MTVERIARIVLNTRDAEALAGFYVAGLGFERRAPDADTIELGLGETTLALRTVGPDAAGYPTEVPGWDTRFQHCAIAVSDMTRAMALLRETTGWDAISEDGPVRLPARSGGVVAFKFRDPDGHPLEFIAFPDDAAARGHPLLRIDHTAISVADVGRSIAFYEALGLRVGGRTLNDGVEQERLDAVPGATVDVVTLALPANTKPHLELLGYLGHDDRPVRQAKSDDVAATRIAFAGTDTPVHLVRDPDGHVLMLGS
jgi:catechol 2,3-dioxygenase-like lactoylglutathione lyase family enzyme